MSTIDAAIIKALVEHVGGDSSCIPDGTIGGKTYTAGEGISIANDQISVEYDANTMEIKNGALAAKTQLTTGDGLTTSNGKIIANLDTNTMQMNSGKISAKTQLAAGNGISIASGKVNVNYDSDTMELKDGKLGVSKKLALTSAGARPEYTYSKIGTNQLCIAQSTPGLIPIASFIRVHNENNVHTWVVVEKITSSNNYKIVNTRLGTIEVLTWDSTKSYYTCSVLKHDLDITEEYGLFIRGMAQAANPNATEVVSGAEYWAMINYIITKLSSA